MVVKDLENCLGYLPVLISSSKLKWLRWISFLSLDFYLFGNSS
jgi:hypothetical protein